MFAPDLAARGHRQRGPSLRFMVKMALKCDNTEQLGQRLKRRYDRRRQRQGGGRGPGGDRAISRPSACAEFCKEAWKQADQKRGYCKTGREKSVS